MSKFMVLPEGVAFNFPNGLGLALLLPSDAQDYYESEQVLVSITFPVIGGRGSLEKKVTADEAFNWISGGNLRNVRRWNCEPGLDCDELRNAPEIQALIQNGWVLEFHMDVRFDIH